MIWLRQSTAVVVSFGPAVLFSDGVTLVTNLVGTGANQTENTSTGIRLSKNGGAFAARHATATASTYDAFGNYLVTLDTTDTGTLGVLRMQYANASAFCPLFVDFMIVPAAVWDTYFASSGGVAFPTSGTLANTINITAAALGATERTAIADAMLDEANGIETSWPVRKVLRILFAALGGKASGMGTATNVIRAGDDSKDRITATTDAVGNRTAVTLDGA